MLSRPLLPLLAFLLSAVDVGFRHGEEPSHKVCEPFLWSIAGDFNFHLLGLLPRRNCGFERLARLRKLFAG